MWDWLLEYGNFCAIVINAYASAQKTISFYQDKRSHICINRNIVIFLGSLDLIVFVSMQAKVILASIQIQSNRN